jgi:hypothetical protein
MRYEIAVLCVHRNTCFDITNRFTISFERHIMSRFTFDATVKHTFPKSPTKAADCIIGLMNRNATSKILGERKLNGRATWALPISHDVMALIIGRDLGHNYAHAFQNPAIAQYYDKVTNRLREIGMFLYFGEECWMCIRGAYSAGTGLTPDLIYQVADFNAEAPASETNAA